MNPMLEETRSIDLERPWERPPSFGMTILARPRSIAPRDLLGRLRGAWAVVSTWGRWSDEELGQWPEPDDALAALPPWLGFRLQEEPEYELQNWFDDLHDRDWVWWSGSVVGDQVKLDVQAFSLPASLWPLTSLVGWAEGEVVSQGDWTEPH